MKSSRKNSIGTNRSLRIETLETRIALDASALVISEFMASNDGTLLDAEGDDSDWIEIFNSGSTTVDLTGLHLTDDAGNLDRWEFQTGTMLEPGAFLVVFASDKDTVFNGTEQHTDFKLSAGGEYLALVDTDGVSIIDDFSPEFPAQLEDLSYGPAMQPFGDETYHVSEGDIARGQIPSGDRLGLTWTDFDFDDASWPITGPTGFGYENNPGDSTNYTAEIETSIASGTTNLYLRVPFTLSSTEDLGNLTLRMKYDDGFVAYINGHRFAEANAPDTLDYNTPAVGGQPDSSAEVFTEFDASAAISHLRIGTNVLAIHALNLPNSSDMLHVPELYSTPSVLITPEDIGYFLQPTPGYGNGSETINGFVEAPTISLPHGFYESSQSVTLSTTTPNSIIVYTTDGSTPQVDGNLSIVNGTQYVAPLNISSTTTLRAGAFRLDYEPSPVAASTYLFVDDIIQQSPQGQLPGPGWAPDELNGQEMDYGIDPDVIALYGSEAVKNSLQSLTTISITTDIGNLFDANDGIYVNATNRGRDWERPASFELIDENGGVQVNAGLRIRGGFGRNDFNPKHAFRFYFREEYGDTKLRYPIFGDEGTDRFDVLDLRTASNYAWSRDGNRQNTFVREVFGRDLQKELGQPYTRSRYHHLYLNGVYFGVYQTQERVQEFYGESYLGGEKEDYDVVKADLGVTGATEVADGNDIAWRALFDLAQDLADNPRANLDNYWTMQGLNPDGTRNENLPVLLDVDNLADYMLVIFYTGGYDAGLSRFLGDNRANNWFGIRNRVTADQGFQFFIHDNEHSLGTNNTDDIDRTGPFNNGNQDNYSQFNPAYLHQDLLTSEEYRIAFADRVRMHMFDGGVMTQAVSDALFLARAAEVDPGIIAESARWGDAHRNTPRNKTDWQNEINSITNGFFSFRNNLVLGQLQDDSLYPTIDAPSYNQYGGEISAGFTLQISAPQGTIYYTVDGTDPREIGGALNTASAQVYSQPITPLNGQTIQARSLHNGQWSALTTATFTQSLVADYDSNGIVDQGDLARWQTEYGDEGPVTADGDQDNDVDGTDFLIWQRDLVQPASLSTVESSAAAIVVDSTDPSDSALPALSDEVAAGNNSELIDAAMALAWLDRDASGDAAAVYEQPYTELIAPSHHIASDIAIGIESPADDAAVDADGAPTSAATSWIADELLERVFD